MTEAIRQRATELTGKVHALREQLTTQIIGQEQLIDDLLTGLLASGHVLLEGLPGLGKTLLVRSLSHGLGLDFSRINARPT